MRQIGLFSLAVALLCCQKESKNHRSSPNQAGIKPGDNHSGGQDLESDALNGADLSDMAKILQLAPLTEGHMISEIIASNRPFHPEKGLGFWQIAGFGWRSAEQFRNYDQSANINFSFSIGADSPSTSSSGSDVSLSCRLDHKEWQPCTDAFSVNELSEGFHEVQVKSNFSQLVLGSARWKTDRSPPQLFLAKYTKENRYQVVANEALTTLECSSAGKAVDCKDGFDGALVASSAISVKAIDLAGNTGQQDLKP